MNAACFNFPLFHDSLLRSLELCGEIQAGHLMWIALAVHKRLFYIIKDYYGLAFWGMGAYLSPAFSTTPPRIQMIQTEDNILDGPFQVLMQERSPQTAELQGGTGQGDSSTSRWYLQFINPYSKIVPGANGTLPAARDAVNDPNYSSQGLSQPWTVHDLVGQQTPAWAAVWIVCGFPSETESTAHTRDIPGRDRICPVGRSVNPPAL